MDNLLSSKFILTVLCIVLTYSLVIMHLATAENFAGLVSVVFIGYGIANVTQKWAPTGDQTMSKVTTVQTTEVKPSTASTALQNGI